MHLKEGEDGWIYSMHDTTATRCDRRSVQGTSCLADTDKLARTRALTRTHTDKLTLAFRLILLDALRVPPSVVGFPDGGLLRDLPELGIRTETVEERPHTGVCVVVVEWEEIEDVRVELGRQPRPTSVHVC